MSCLLSEPSFQPLRDGAACTEHPSYDPFCSQGRGCLSRCSAPLRPTGAPQGHSPGRQPDPKVPSGWGSSWALQRPSGALTGLGSDGLWLPEGLWRWRQVPAGIGGQVRGLGRPGGLGRGERAGFQRLPQRWHLQQDALRAGLGIYGKMTREIMLESWLGCWGLTEASGAAQGLFRPEGESLLVLPSLGLRPPNGPF